MKQFGMMVGLNKRDAFEGWFCKIDDKENDLMFSIIWGYSTHEETRHAFIQFQESIRHKTIYKAYPIEAMKWVRNPFMLEIGRNKLSERGLVLDFEAEGTMVKADLRFGDFSPIRKSLLKPNIMGWLTYLPNECNHSIISMDHTVSGSISMGDHTWEIMDSAGYLEKDWGTSFPREYVWVQANDWKNSSLVFSYATVPILGRHAKGFFLVLHHEGQEYRLTSIEGSQLTGFKVSQDSFSASLKNKDIKVTLKARQANPVSLSSPVGGEMKSHIKESLDGTLELVLERKGGDGIPLFSERASIDVHFNYGSGENK